MRNIFKFTLVSALLVSCISYVKHANAADLPRRNTYSAPAFTAKWAGFYGGLHVGYGFGKARSAEIDGFLSGVQAGFNLQTGPVVFGGEIDASYSGIDYRAFTDTFRQKWLGSGRVRVGYAFERFLPFITAGVAYTNGTMKAGGAKETNGHIGFVVGVGGEMMITERVSANLQFLHYRFGSETYNVLPAARSANIVTNVLRIGMNYRF